MHAKDVAELAVLVSGFVAATSGALGGEFSAAASTQIAAAIAQRIRQLLAA